MSDRPERESFTFQLEVPSIGYIETTVVMDSLTPKEVWDTRNTWESFIGTSQKEWEKMTNDQRESVVKIVKQAVEAVYDRAEEWIPEALEVKSGHFVDVYFRIILTDIDRDIIQTEKATTFRLREAEDFADELIAQHQQTS